MNAQQQLQLSGLVKASAKVDKWLRQMVASGTKIRYPFRSSGSPAWEDTERIRELGSEYRRMLTPGMKTNQERFNTQMEAIKSYHRNEGFSDPVGLFTADPVIQRSRLQPVTAERIGQTVKGMHSVDQALTEPVRAFRSAMSDTGDSLAGGIKNRISRHNFLNYMRRDMNRPPLPYPGIK